MMLFLNVSRLPQLMLEFFTLIKSCTYLPCRTEIISSLHSSSNDVSQSSFQSTLQSRLVVFSLDLQKGFSTLDSIWTIVTYFFWHYSIKLSPFNCLYNSTSATDIYQSFGIWKVLVFNWDLFIIYNKFSKSMDFFFLPWFSPLQPANNVVYD